MDEGNMQVMEKVVDTKEVHVDVIRCALVQLPRVTLSR